MVTILRAGFWPRGPGGASTAVFLVLLTFLSVLPACGSRQPADTNSTPIVDVTARAERRPFVHTIRVSGLVAASRSFAVTAPRLAGATMSMLIVTRLVASGASVRQGDLLVEFDRQAQIKNAFDRRGEYLDLLAQIKKKQADQRTARAGDRTVWPGTYGLRAAAGRTSSLLPTLRCLQLIARSGPAGRATGILTAARGPSWSLVRPKRCAREA